MNTTIKTSRGPVRFHSVGEPIAGIPAGYYFNGDRTITRGPRIVAKAFFGEEFRASEMVGIANSATELLAALEDIRRMAASRDAEDWQGVCTDIESFARAALAKAKGVQS